MHESGHPKPERRRHRRLTLHWPIECTANLDQRRRVFRGVTENISAGGVYLRASHNRDDAAPATGALLDVAFTVPPGEGHFPFEGRVRGRARVIRCEPIRSPVPADRAAAPAHEGSDRLGIAVAFEQPVQLVF